MKIKGQRLTSTGNLKRNSTAVRKMTSTVLLKSEKKMNSLGDYVVGDGSQN
jgi:hypothetical protein